MCACSAAQFLQGLLPIHTQTATMRAGFYIVCPILQIYATSSLHFGSPTSTSGSVISNGTETRNDDSLRPRAPTNEIQDITMASNKPNSVQLIAYLSKSRGHPWVTPDSWVKDFVQDSLSEWCKTQRRDAKVTDYFPGGLAAHIIYAKRSRSDFLVDIRLNADPATPMVDLNTILHFALLSESERTTQDEPPPGSPWLRTPYYSLRSWPSTQLDHKKKPFISLRIEKRKKEPGRFPHHYRLPTASAAGISAPLESVLSPPSLSKGPNMAGESLQPSAIPQKPESGDVQGGRASTLALLRQTQDSADVTVPELAEAEEAASQTTNPRRPVIGKLKQIFACFGPPPPSAS